MAETKEIIVFDVKQYDIEENRASEIKKAFDPMLKKMVELESEYNEVVGKPIDQELCNKARELRLKYAKVRTGTAAIHKTEKSFYRQMGLAIDGWKNAQLAAGEGKEKALKDIEDHFVNIEKEKIETRYNERSEKLREIEQDYIPADLGEMEEAIWKNYFANMKAGYELKKKEEAAAAEREKRDRERKSKFSEMGFGQRQENFVFGDDEIEYPITKILDSSEEEFPVIIEEVKKSIDQIREEKRLKDEEAERLRKENEKKEREKKRLELKNKQLKEAEEKRKQAEKDAKDKEARDKEAARQKALSAPDKVKLEKLAADLLSVEIPNVSSVSADQILAAAKTRLNDLTAFITKECDKL